MNNNNVVVCARIKKPVANNNDEGDCIKVIDDEELELSTFTLAGTKTTLNFKLDRVFDSHSSQEDVFTQLVKPMIIESLNGYNMTLFSYGQTGSGKTFTMQGIGKEESRGIVYRVVEELFCLLPISTTPASPVKTNTTTRTTNIDNDKALMVLSCLEIYQERLIDLLLPNSNAHLQRQRSLRIRQRPDGSVWVEKLSEVNVHNLTTFSTQLDSALKRRATGSHRMNAESSRSHLLIIVSLSYPSHIHNNSNSNVTTSKDTETAKTSIILTSKIHLIDLAGSEMVRKTEASGARLQEAKHINKSLSALGNVIYALTEVDSGNSINSPYIPFRDSKLTRLLKDSLGGNSKTALILTLATGISNVNESTATLRFGERARQLRTQPRINVTDTASTSPNNDANVDYSAINADLLLQIQGLQSQLFTAQSTITDLQDLHMKANDQGHKLVQLQEKDCDNGTERNLISLSCHYCNTWCGDVIQMAESDVHHDKGKLCGLHADCLDALKQSYIASGLKTAVISIDTRNTAALSGSSLIENEGGSTSVSPLKDTPSLQAQVDPEREILGKSQDNDFVSTEGESDEDDGDYYRCGVCLMTKEESDKWTLDTGERLGDMFGCDGNCGCLFHVRCVGLIGEGGQYALPEQEWYCNICSPDIDLESFIEDSNIDNETHSVNADTDKEEINSNTNHDLLDNSNTTPLSPQTHVSRRKAEAALSRLRNEHDHMRRDRNAVLRQWQGEKELNKAQELRRLEMKKNFDKELYEAKKEIELLRNECKEFRFKNERLEMKVNKIGENPGYDSNKKKEVEEDDEQRLGLESHTPSLSNSTSSAASKSRLRGQLERDVAAATSIYSSETASASSPSGSNNIRDKKESGSGAINDHGEIDPLQVPVYYEGNEATLSNSVCLSATSANANPEDDPERESETKNYTYKTNNSYVDNDIADGDDENMDMMLDVDVNEDVDEDSGDYREQLESAENGVWNRGRWRNLLNTPASKQQILSSSNDNLDIDIDMDMRDSSFIHNPNNQTLLSKSMNVDRNVINDQSEITSDDGAEGHEGKDSTIPKPWLNNNTSLSPSLNSTNKDNVNDRSIRKGRRPPPDTTSAVALNANIVAEDNGATCAVNVSVSLSDRINSLLEDVEQESEDMRLLKQRMKARDEQRAEILAERGPLSQVKRREDGERRRHLRHSKGKEEQ